MVPLRQPLVSTNMKHKLAYRRVCLQCDAIEPLPVSECKPKYSVAISEQNWQKLISFAEYRGMTLKQVVDSWIETSQINPYRWSPYVIRSK